MEKCSICGKILGDGSIWEIIENNRRKIIDVLCNDTISKELQKKYLSNRKS